MNDTSMRVNSYRDLARNRTLYQLVAEVGGMHRSVEFNSAASAADIAIVLRLLAKEIDDIVVVGAGPPDPWAAARAQWIAQAEGGARISHEPRGTLNLKKYFMSNIEEIRRLDAQQQIAGPHAQKPAIQTEYDVLVAKARASTVAVEWADRQHQLRSGDEAA